MQTIEMIIDDNDVTSGVYAISLVDLPAIEENFLLLQNDKKSNKYTLATVIKDTDEQHIITGPALIPDKEIYRYNEVTGEKFNIVFNKKTIQRCAELFFKRKQNDQVTLDHEEAVEGITFFESWLISDNSKDKSTALGYSLPEGTWMLSAKVEDEKIWNSLKDGKYRGFSIEAYFVNKFSKNVKTENELIQELHDMLLMEEFNQELFEEKIKKN
jgi:hypothetical protein